MQCCIKMSLHLLYHSTLQYCFCEAPVLRSKTVKNERREEEEEEEEEEMGGGHGDGHSTTYKGFTMHHPKRWHTLTGKGMCAIMWFWVLYRAKQDGPVVLGWRHPWEGHGHGDHSEHGHEHDEASH